MASHNILLVEDNDDDAFFTERAFKSEPNVHFFRCIDGKEVINYLEGNAPFTKRSFHPLPDLILIDLSLPDMSGLEVLEWIRKHEKFHPTIVVALTGSKDPDQIAAAYRLHINGYLSKTSSVEGMAQVVKSIRTCWLENASVGAILA